MPNRIRLGSLKRVITHRVRGTNNITGRFGAVTMSSNVTVNRDNVLCSLPDHSLVTSSIRCVIGTRYTSTLIYVSGYSGVAPNVLVTTVHLGVPIMFVSNKPVRTNGVLTDAINGDRGGRSDGNDTIHGLSLISTVVSTTSSDVDSRSITTVRTSTYPAYNSYSNVFATGSVGYLARTLKLTLPNGNSLLTARSLHHRLFLRTNHAVISLTGHHCRRSSSSMLPHSVTDGTTFRGTVALSVTVNNSAGAVLRLLTTTGRTRISFGVSSVSHLDHNIPYLTGITPTSRGCRVRSIRHTNNIFTLLTRLSQSYQVVRS